VSQVNVPIYSGATATEFCLRRWSLENYRNSVLSQYNWNLCQKFTTCWSIWEVPYSHTGWYGNDYLIAFKLRPLCKCTLAPSILLLLGAPADGSLGIFLSSAVEFDLMFLMVRKLVPLRPIFRVGDSQKSLEARSGEWGVTRSEIWRVRCHSERDLESEVSSERDLESPVSLGARSREWGVTRSEIWRVRWDSERDLESTVSLGARFGECGDWVMTQQEMCGSVRYRDAETTVPACHLSSNFLRTASRNLCKSGMYKWPVTLCPDGMISWRTKHSILNNSENNLAVPVVSSHRIMNEECNWRWLFTTSEVTEDKTVVNWKGFRAKQWSSSCICYPRNCIVEL
jgi:hypothetical protein